jgi:hypothetical protein
MILHLSELQQSHNFFHILYFRFGSKKQIFVAGIDEKYGFQILS